MFHLNEADKARFFAKIDRLGPDECWPWLACKVRSGHGRFGVGGRRGRLLIAHRVAYALTHGLFDETLCVLHRCDNPCCCNPGHLFLGTQADNLKDMWSKGRARPGHVLGARNGAAKITAETALAIGGARGTVREIAKQFGIGKSQVSNIRRGVSGWTVR